ncbi:MAG: chemotaxis protein CheW [Candidatus Acidiferrales bacterium]
MSLRMESDSQSFVLLRLGERRFALAAKHIAELVAPSRVFRFPHQTPEIEGVILRRGRIVPVCDVAERLIGKSLKSRRLYLIALRRYTGQAEWIALPVTGECELINAEMSPPSDADSPHVAGWLSHAGDVIEVLNLDGLTPGPTDVAAVAVPLEAEEARP